MVALLLAAVTAAVCWKLTTGPAFLRAFASLLREPERGGVGLLGRLTFDGFVGGEHEGRPVTLVLKHRRRNRLGYLVLGMATKTTLRWSGSKTTAGTTVSTSRMREALDVLIGRHGLTLELDGGWLRATWMPVGFFVFPGRLDPEKWREVLAHMQVLASELENDARASGVSPAAASPPG